MAAGSVASVFHAESSCGSGANLLSNESICGLYQDYQEIELPNQSVSECRRMC